MNNTTPKPTAITKINKPMAQQTAVEWLREQYVHITWMVNRDELPTDTVFEFMLNRFEQAKQMEKEQHYYSCVNVIEGVLNKVEKGEKTNSRDVFDQYYTQTYGNNQNK